MTANIEESVARAAAAHGGSDRLILDKILSDQLQDIFEGLRFSMPISSALSCLILAMQLAEGGHFLLSIAWFSTVNTVNGTRLAEAINHPGIEAVRERGVEDIKRKLARSKVFAALAGVLWAGIAILTDGFGVPNSSFYLVILAGICAGAVSYGAACAPVVVNFITPPLVTTIICLSARAIWQEGLLAFAVTLFWYGLVRSAALGQRRFIEASKLKHEATRTAGEMETRSHEDPLTGLLNRRGLEHAVQRYSPPAGSFIVMLIDLDGFKAVNDTYGHKAGDDLLVAITWRIRGVVPDHSVLARIGGDEFVLLYPETPDVVEASRVAAGVIESVIADYQGVLSVEVGTCVGACRVKQLDLATMLPHADFALYRAKRRGRNSYCFFYKQLQREWERKQSIERDLRLAINTQQIEAHFQPVVELQGRRIIGFEALMRWNHPQHGPISPPEIVDVASEIGMVQQLTRCIALNCFEMIERLTSCGHHNLVVAMNLSPRELLGGRTSREILSDMKNRQLPWHMFEVEITEDAPFDQYDVDQALNLLATSGVSVALDDFGTGFATFASLKKGLIRKIKIDQLFVRGISRSVRDQNLVCAIVELGQALDIEVTAEGIECAEDCRTLLRLGCTKGQGFLFSPALPMERAIEMLKECPFSGAPLHQQAVRRRAEISSRTADQ